MITIIIIGNNIMTSCFSRGFLTTLQNPQNASSNSSEKRYDFFEVRTQIIEKLGGYKNMKKMYKIKGIRDALNLARDKGLRQCELDQLLKSAEELQKNEHKNTD